MNFTSNDLGGSLSKIPTLLGAKNYFEWRRAISPVLLGFRALSIVEGKDFCPTIGEKATTIDLKQYETWQDRDAKAMSIIEQTVCGSLKAMIEDLTSSAEKWAHLAKLNNLKTSEHRLRINKKLTNLFLDEGGDMAQHLGKFVELVAEAKEAGLSWGLDDAEKADRFLDTLPHSFALVKVRWQGLEKSERNFFSLVKLYNEEETSRQLSNERMADAAAMAAFHQHRNSKNKGSSGQQSKPHGKSNTKQSGGNSSAERCSGCGKRGHSRAECRKTKHLPPDAVVCWKCFNVGHRTGECPGSKQDQANSAIFGNGHALRAQASEQLMVAGQYGPNTHAFLVDSGASAHIVAHEWMLSSPRKIPEVKFNCVGASSVATLQGTVKGELLDGAEVSLRDAYYLPEAQVNILSEELLLERGWRKVIGEDPETAVLQHVTSAEKRLPLHKHGRGRYLIVKFEKHEKSQPCNMVARPYCTEQSLQESQECDTVATAVSEPIQAGSLMDHHVKLGHVGMPTLRKLAKADLIKVSDPESFKESKLWCETCIQAKSARDPFGDTPLRASKPLEVVVSDVSGPFKPSIGGFVYFATFIDDFTDLTSVALLKTKDEVFPKMKTWIAQTENVLEHKVQVIRSDGGGEYVNNAMTAWMEARGILHQITTPHTPQLNGKAERKNRTLKEMTAAMLIGSNMGFKWWGHALNFATTVLARITEAPDGRSLWEMIYKRKPNLLEAHAFGEDCWVHIPAADRSKSDLASSKAWKGKLVGWSTDRSGWAVYSPETDKIVLSRDVKFEPCNLVARPYCTSSQDQEIAEPGKPATIILEDPVEFDMPEEAPAEAGDEAAQHTPAGGAESQDVPTPTARQDPPRRVLPHREGRGQNPDWYRNNFAMFLQEAEGHLFPISTVTKDPLTYEEAMSRPNPERQEWVDAIQREFQSLIKNGTLEEVVVPEGANIVTTKHVFKTKYDANGNFVKRKDRCVARGFTQEFGVDYDDTYAPVARMTSLRIFLVMVVVHGLKTRQTDVETAFLNPKMDRPLYIEFPEGWNQLNPKATGLLVKKGLYGFKQSARLWWLHLMQTLFDLGFDHSEFDWGIFIRHEQDGSFTIVFVYVDDMLIAGSTQSAVDSVQDGLKKAYSMTDIGEISSVLGMSVKITKDAAFLAQTAYIETVLDRFGLAECKSEPTPIAAGTKLVKEGEPIEGGKDGIRKYQALIGCLLWIALSTRPDISYAVSTLARFNASPTKEHWRTGMRVLRYLQGTKDLNLTLKPDSSVHSIVGYSDADWAGDAGTRQSQSGYVFKLHDCTISWASLRQDRISLSSTESEYVALTEAGKESAWLKRAMSDYGDSYDEPVLLRGDNQGSLALASNPGFHRRTKHIELRYHYIRKLKESGEVDTEYVDTHSQLADILTKAVPEAVLVKHRRSMGLQPRPK